MRYLLAPLCAMAALFTFVAPAHADPDPYSPDIPTGCHIGTPGVVAGQRVVLNITVSSNSTVPASGQVRIAVTSNAPGRVAQARVAPRTVWSTTVRYDGSPVRVTGPRLPNGSYQVRMRFTPDDGAYVACDNSAALRVGASGGADDNAGALPDTGGPHLLFLVAGVGLVGAGAGLVGGGRRRRA